MELTASLVCQGAAAASFGVGAVSALSGVLTARRDSLGGPPEPASEGGWAPTIATGVGLVATLVALFVGSRPVEAGEAARMFVSTADEALLALAAGTAFVYLWLCFDVRFRAAGTVFLPALAVIVLAAIALRIFGRSEARVGEGALMAMHMLTVVAAAVAYTSGFVGGLLFLMQLRRLTGRRTASVFGRLPALETLEHFNYRAAAVGFPLLTIGVVTGFLAFGRGGEGAPDPAPAAWVKIGLALMAWVGYGLLILLVPRYNAQRVAQLNVAGFAVLLAVLVVARFAFN